MREKGAVINVYHIPPKPKQIAGGALSLLWFKRRLPTYACKFIEMVLMITADHGPAVSGAYDQGLSPREYGTSMRKQNKLIKSRNNPDLRVKIITEYAKENFSSTPILDYALAVEQITTAKKDNLILNVVGGIACIFVDLLRHSGAFTD